MKGKSPRSEWRLYYNSMGLCPTQVGCHVVFFFVFFSSAAPLALWTFVDRLEISQGQLGHRVSTSSVAPLKRAFVFFLSRAAFGLHSARRRASNCCMHTNNPETLSIHVVPPQQQQQQQKLPHWETRTHDPTIRWSRRFLF